ncbi:hypothetical protein EV356DRAFT_568262 [Viridothelium virens]|uniref:N-acetyltransferase domain-containing protein n=1 Tax=Viridothelium virens TaxID=1048519 RepID=A0A6A6H509_VIRVR|nr:hypothetical protein EV356DRAFT_568262 [Viridothelium virens]
MADSKSYIISTLPNHTTGQTDFEALVTRARNFRLQSLQLAPESFGATYETEVQRTPEYWTGRIANPKATTFVACRCDQYKIQDTSIDSSKTFLDTEWLGWIVLLGPNHGPAEFSLHTSPWSVIHQDSEHHRDKGQEPKELPRWLINGMFVMPKARGLGLGRALMNAALGRAAEKSREGGADTLKCTIIVDKENDPARTFYLHSGFEIVKEDMFRPEIGKERPALTMELTRSV